MIKAVLLVILFIIPYTICRKCISCTHDPKTAQNFDCVGGNSTAGNFTGEITEDVAGEYTVECTEEGGTEYCFTLVTSEPDWSSGGAFPSKIEDMVFIFKQISIVIVNFEKYQKWNRGCCDVKDGIQTCPRSGANHVDNDYFKIWRYKCAEDEDNCNFYAPKGIGSGGGGSASNGVGNCEDLDFCR